MLCLPARNWRRRRLAPSVAFEYPTPVMKPLLQSETTTPTLIHHFDEVFGVKIPLPALQRGWLHGRELTQPWHVERIVEKLGDQCWFSHFWRDKQTADAGNLNLKPIAIAGFWPSGGFIELLMKDANPLDEHPRGTLAVYSEAPTKTEALMTELFDHYRHSESATDSQPRVGILNYSYNSLSVERIPITSNQTVARERVDLFYGDGAIAWVNEWIGALQSRRYGLTILTGAPGTGKTSLLRSLAHWLSSSHVFYFMPAARFASVESGEIVTFWADENRNSKLRKVLILEDAESIMMRRGEDNREKVATLLNLTDGMLGDALGLHVVCTLNSELADLDPALLRPGRLVAHRDFELLAAEQAQRLAKELGLPAPRSERVSLADLFNAGTQPKTTAPSRRKALGFHTTLQNT
jgi:ATPase family associated with various cellular activities (AAA)